MIDCRRRHGYLHILGGEMWAQILTRLKKEDGEENKQWGRNLAPHLKKLRQLLRGRRRRRKHRQLQYSECCRVLVCRHCLSFPVLWYLRFEVVSEAVSSSRRRATQARNPPWSLSDAYPFK
jgi:hypothetical protein